MIVSKEPIPLVVSRVSREMMPCSNPVLTLSLPYVPTLRPYLVSLTCVPTLCPAWRSDRYEWRCDIRGGEGERSNEQRSSLLGGRERCVTKQNTRVGDF